MSERTKWHEILGTELRLLLTPLNIVVHTNLDVMSSPPQADIVILRSDTGGWTAEQMACLPDSIRDTAASHVLIEFKFSESLTEHHLRKIQGYHAFYQQSQSLRDEQLQSFILTSKTPGMRFRRRYEYERTSQAGVYHSNNVLLENIPLITLNELADRDYNAYVKCFASRKVERRKAFERLAQLSFEELSQGLWFFLLGLRQKMNMEGEKETMEMKVTPEDIARIGEEIGTEYLEKWLLHLPAERRLRGMATEDVLSRYKPEEVLSLYKPEDVLSLYKPEDVLSRYKPEEVLSYNRPMEDYVTKQKRDLLIEGLQRSLRIRFGVSGADWQEYEARLQPLDFATLEHLSEVVLLVSDEPSFVQALSEIEADVSN